MSLLLLTLLSQQDDETVRARIPALVQKLADDDVAARGAARKELFALPLGFVLDVLLAGEKAEDAEARAVVSEIRALSAWTTLLPGTIGEARATLQRLQDRRDPAWVQTREKVFDGFLPRRPAEATAALESLLGSPHEGLRAFALAGLVRFPPASAARLLPLLRNSATGSAAAEAIVATGDASVLPAVLEMFLSGKVEARYAAEVLMETGPGDSIDRVAEVARKDENLVDEAVEILARAGPAAEPALLSLSKVEHADKDDLVAALKKVGGPASIPAVRSYFEINDDPDERDDVLFLLRDPAWPAERLDAARKDPKILQDLYPMRLASRGGAGLRDRVLDWLRQPGVKVSVRKFLLPVLGVAGRDEDAPLLLEALRDARLRDEAAEALDMLGDPAHAGALLEALKRCRRPERLHRLVLGSPAEALEDDLVEILEDPDGYDDIHQRAAVALAARRLTPRLKESLLAVLDSPRLARGDRAGDGLAVLCERLGKEDLPRLAALRSHEDKEVQVSGQLLALRAGDPSAAAPLAALLAGESIRLRLGNDDFPFFEKAAPAGKGWTDAVLREWRKKPSWNEAAFWLSRRDVREAHDRLRPLLEGRNERAPAERALGACGVPEALDGIMKRVLAGRGLARGDDEDESILAAASGRERRARVLAAARGGGRAGEPALRVAAKMAIPDGLTLYRERLRADQSDEDWEEDEDPVTPWCVEAVVRLKAREAVPELRWLLRSRHPLNRALAAGALAELGDRGSVPLIAPLLDDPFEARNGDNRDDDENFTPVRRVWHAAMEALEKLSGGKGEGSSVARRRAYWRAWYEKNRGAYR